MTTPPYQGVAPGADPSTEAASHERPAAALIRSASGASAVEFAIVAPLFFMSLIGILVYGLYFGTVHSVQQIAADAARASIAGLNDAERVKLATDHVQLSTANYLLLNSAKMQVDATPDGADSNLFVVTVTYDASDLPIYGLDKLVPVPQPTIRRSAVIRRGGY